MQVCRCDNPGCTKGPGAGPQVALSANPPGWVKVRVEAGAEKDCCSADCVAEVTTLALGGVVIHAALTKLKL